MRDEDRLALYETTLRIDGKLRLSQANAEWYLAKIGLTVRPDPERPGLIRIERHSPAPPR